MIDEIVKELCVSSLQRDGISKANNMPFRVKVSQGLELSHVSGPKQPQLEIPFTNTPYRYIRESVIINAKVILVINLG